jgi:hypothetical protein
MNKRSQVDACFQCGKPRITTGTHKEYFNGSLVTTTESVCSDPECQKRTTDTLSKEKARRDESMNNKRIFGRKPKVVKKEVKTSTGAKATKNFL